MSKSILSCATCVHIEILHTNDYYVYEQIYLITVHVVNLFYMIMCHICLIFSIICLFVYIICILYIFSSCGAILSLTADHLPS